MVVAMDKMLANITLWIVITMEPPNKANLSFSLAIDYSNIFNTV